MTDQATAAVNVTQSENDGRLLVNAPDDVVESVVNTTVETGTQCDVDKPEMTNESNVHPNDATVSHEDEDVLNWHVLSGMEEAQEMIRRYELENRSKFSVYRSSKGFGSTDPKGSKHKIWWSGSGRRFDGVPYCILGERLLDCRYGVDRKPNKKVKRENRTSKSIKKGCAAQIKIKEIMLFEEFRIKMATSFRKSDASKKLRDALLADKVVTGVRQFLLFLPPNEMHSGHVIGAEPKEVYQERDGDQDGCDALIDTSIQIQIDGSREILLEPLLLHASSKKRKNPSGNAELFREQLDEIRKLSFFVEDKNTFEETLLQLQYINTVFLDTIQKQHITRLEKEKKRKKRKKLDTNDALTNS